MAAFDVDGARKAGYSDTEIADHLAGEAKFDAPAARKAGYSDAEIISHVGAPQPTAQTLAVRKAEEDRAGGTTRQNLAAGLVRGAGSIGATIMAPFDAAARGLGVDPNGAVGEWVGRTDRREAMTDALQLAGANPDSLAFKGGKIGAEVAGTLGVGGAVANTVARVPGAAAAMPGVINAIRTGGMTTGTRFAPVAGMGAGVARTAPRLLADLGTRAVGGAITGAASAGLVEPGQAGMGAAVGGGLPVVLKGAGAIGSAIGRTIRGPEVTPSLRAGVDAARSAGYVIPPTQAKPTLSNRLLEGLAGKITTAQNASAKNQQVTNALAKAGIGADELTSEGLAAVRARANDAYTKLGQVGELQADDAFRTAMDKVGASTKQLKVDFPELVNKDVDALAAGFAGKDRFNAESAIEALKRLRADGSANRGALDPEKKALGKAQMKIAEALEGLVDRNLQAQGKPELLDAFRSARQTLAKVYDVEKALNPASGNVDANKLAALLKKGRPLSGELKQVAEFASQFPKAAQTTERMGSLPQLSPLDWVAGGAMGAASGNPLMLASILARPAARAAALSPMVQNRLATDPAAPNALSRLLANQSLQQAGYRTAPLIAADR